MKFHAVVIHDRKGVIAVNGNIPWRFSEDMKRFRKLTMGHAVIMGRKTFDTLQKPLAGRINIVLTRNEKYCTYNTCSEPCNDTCRDLPDLYFVKSYHECIDLCKGLSGTRNQNFTFFVIGGGEIYEMFHPVTTKEYITLVNVDIHADNLTNTESKDEYVYYGKTRLFSDSVTNSTETVHVPNLFKWDTSVSVNTSVNTCITTITFMEKQMYNREEVAFLNCMRTILERPLKENRCDSLVSSICGTQLKFSIRNNRFPMLTTRRLFFRGIFEELMLFIRGQSDSTILEKKGINIWRGNTNRAYLDKVGCNNLPEGDMGPSYGFNLRHFGAKYVDCRTNYAGQGFDQLHYIQSSIINSINSVNSANSKTNDRRLVISLWDPNQLCKAPLPPCLYGYQFIIGENRELSCIMTQRSSDIMLAGGWNVAFGALFTILIAHYAGLKPNELIWNGADVHIYNNLMDDAKEQIERYPNIFPELYLRDMPKKIEDIEFGNLVLAGYDPYTPVSNSEKVKLPMNA